MNDTEFFSERQIKELKKAFDLRANALNQKLSSEKMKNTIKSLRLIPTPSEQDLEQMCSYKEVNFETFVTIVYMYMRSVSRPSHLLKSFEFFDKNKTGYLKFDDCLQLLNIYGYLLSSNQKEVLKNEMEIDENGNINYIKFINKIYPSEN